MAKPARKGAEEARNQLPDLLAAAESGRSTVITKHGRYTGLAGWFDVNGSTATIQRAKNDQAAAANSLCGLGAANGIDCAVVSQPGKHDWPFASHAFAAALPWLAGQIGTPDVPPTPLPAQAGSPTFEQTAAR